MAPLPLLQRKAPAPSRTSDDGKELFCGKYKHASVTVRNNILRDGIQGYGKLPRQWKTLKRNMLKHVRSIVQKELHCGQCDKIIPALNPMCCGELQKDERGHDKIISVKRLLRYRYTKTTYILPFIFMFAAVELRTTQNS